MRKKLRGHELRFILLFLIPTLLIFSVFILFPYLNAFRIVLYNWSGISIHQEFVGLKNILFLFKDPQLPGVIKNNLFILIVVPLITFLLAMFYAVVLVQLKIKESKLYKVFFFLPYILPVSVVAILWNTLFDYNYGIITPILNFIGIKLDYSLLYHPRTVLQALCLPMIWSVFGFYMILYMTALINIPQHLFDAASIDGANERQKFFHIVVPLIWETIRTSLVLFILSAFNYTFALPFIIFPAVTPGGKAELLPLYMWRLAQRFNNYGYSTTIGLLIFVISISLSLVVLKMTKRDQITY